MTEHERFIAAVKEFDEGMTAARARRVLIEEGVVDKNGKPMPYYKELFND